MSIKDYLRASGFDFLLCLIISICVGFINCGGFMVSDDLRMSPVALLLSTAVPLAIMFAAAWSRKTVLPGAAALVVVLAATCLIAHAVAGTETLFSDIEANPVPFIIIMFVTSAVTFLMTRRKWLSRAFVLAAILDMCFVEFMYKQGYWPMLVVALIAAGAMVVYRNYRTNLRDASTEKISFLSAFGIGSVYSLALAAVACLVFVVVIAPLNPPAKEVKLFTRYMNYETVEMTGVGSTKDNPDQEDRTNQTNDALMDTSKTPDPDDDQNVEEDQNLTPFDNPAIGALADLAEKGAQSLQEMFNYLIANPPAFALFWIVVLAIIASPFVIKKRLRARWYEKTCALPAQECVKAFYLFFLKRFDMLKVTKPEEATLIEWAEGCSGVLNEFSKNEKAVDFKVLTGVYCNAAYGRVDPTEQELEGYKAYYRNFYKAFATQSGRLKYCLRFFRV